MLCELVHAACADPCEVRSGRTNLRAPKGRAVCVGAHAAASALVKEIADANSAQGPSQTSCSISLLHPAQRRFNGSKHRVAGEWKEAVSVGLLQERKSTSANVAAKLADVNCKTICRAKKQEIRATVAAGWRSFENFGRLLEQRYCEIVKSCGPLELAGTIWQCCCRISILF